MGREIFSRFSEKFQNVKFHFHSLSLGGKNLFQAGKEKVSICKGGKLYILKPKVSKCKVFFSGKVSKCKVFFRRKFYILKLFFFPRGISSGAKTRKTVNLAEKTHFQILHFETFSGNLETKSLKYIFFQKNNFFEKYILERKSSPDFRKSFKM